VKGEQVRESLQINQVETLEIKSSSSQIKNAVESHSRRLEQVEDKTLGLEDKEYTIEKNR
jgi:hypothetical protein